MGVGNAIIGALRVVLGAETAAFENGLKNANRSLSTFAANAAKAGAAVATAMTAVATGIGYAVQRALTDADNMGKAAQSIGIPVEELSRLRYAADLSGVAFQSLQTAMSRFSRNMAEAASDAQSTSARAFSAIGVSATDAAGQLRPATAVMGDVAERFSRMQDGAGKTALAIALFGRAGADMIPMLNQGRAGLHGLMREADELGIVISRQTAAAAERFNDNLSRIKAVASGFQLHIAERLLPALEFLAQKFLGVAKDGESVKQIAEFINNTFVVLVQTGATVAHVFSRIGAELIALKDAAAALFRGEFSRAGEIMAAAAAETERARAALTAFNQELAAAGAQLNAQIAQAPAVVQAQAPIIASTRSMADAMRAAKDAARAALDEIINAPTETFVNKMRAVEAALRSGTITMQQFGNMTRTIQKQNVQHMHDLASATSQALTTIFSKSKVAAIAAAVINTAQGITRNLAMYPQPLAGIMAGITAASGAAQIAAIRSTNMGGGGSAPSAYAGGGGATEPASQLPQQTLHIEGVSPDRWYQGDAVRGLAERLIDYQRQGGQVVLA